MQDHRLEKLQRTKKENGKQMKVFTERNRKREQNHFKLFQQTCLTG